MKKIMIMASMLLAASAAAGARAEDSAGSNQGGSEKVCFAGPNAQSEPALSELLKSCRRGDILDIGWLSTPAAMQLCDFTKAVIYHPTKNSVVACVYTGARRPVIK